ncbi:MAG: glycosyltransferase family 4 protein [Candidatus Magasanikbacteria bacterium]
MEKEIKDLNILTITQTIDESDPILSPFLKWFKTFAKKAKKCFVICLYKGNWEEVGDMEVNSLGKEKGLSRIGYLFNLYKYSTPRLLKRKIDVIFVHMNSIYILLLGPLAFLTRTPIVWWKAHGNLNDKAKFALNFVDYVVTSSETGFNIDTDKRRIVGQGIDTDYFSLKEKYSDEVQEIVSVSRISEVKDLETLIKAVNILVTEHDKKGLSCKIIGKPRTVEDEDYLRSLKNLVKELDIEENVNFVGAVPHNEIKDYYHQADVFVNTSDTGSLDKTVLESMASGTIVANSNYGFKEMLKPFGFCQFEQSNEQKLVENILEIDKLNKEEKRETGKELREIVLKKHNLRQLTQRILEVFKEAANK